MILLFCLFLWPCFRLRDKAGNIVETPAQSAGKNSGAYVPPARRLQPLSDRKRAEVERMRKQLKGLINRSVKGYYKLKHWK